LKGRKKKTPSKEEILLKALKIVAPGSELREGIDHIISGKTGALIVIGDSEEVLKISDGGIKVDTPFSAARLAELAKMDGAMLIDDNLERIVWANVHLNPDPHLSTSETGMRHRTAERVAKQTDALVIAISQRRDIVSLYVDHVKYVLPDTEVILAKANQALQTLERYKQRFEQVSANLNHLEFEDMVIVGDVVTALQKSELVARVAREIERYIVELGVEGRLIQMQLDELMAGLEDERLMLVKDYAVDSRKAEKILKSLAKLSPDTLLNSLEVAKLLGYEGSLTVLETPVHPKGYRLLRKIPRLPVGVVGKIVDKFQNLQNIISASVDELDDVDGVGEVRARAIREGLRRLKEVNQIERTV
jgi:diadenylate cyclase